MAKIWTGGIYLADEGGSEIVMRSLAHYKKRLATLHSSPELKDAAAMFASVLQQQAAKTIPEIDALMQKITGCLLDGAIRNLEGDVAFMRKALECRMADIQKAQDTGHEYFVRLAGADARRDLVLIKEALDGTGRYLEPA